MLLSMCVRFVNTSFELVQVGLNNSLTSQQFKFKQFKKKTNVFQKRQICNDPSSYFIMVASNRIDVITRIIKMLTIYYNNHC